MKNPLHKDIDSSHLLTRRDNYGRFGRIGAPSPRERERESVLADWLGPERAPGVFAKLRPDARPIGLLATAIVRGLQPAELERMEQIRQRWPEIVGNENAEHFVPMSVDSRQMLEVGFFSPVWRFALDTPSNKSLIMTRVAELTGCELKGIRFVLATQKKTRAKLNQ